MNFVSMFQLTNVTMIISKKKRQNHIEKIVRKIAKINEVFD